MVMYYFTIASKKTMTLKEVVTTSTDPKSQQRMAGDGQCYIACCENYDLELHDGGQTHVGT
jgi:hypothetical protein